MYSSNDTEDGEHPGYGPVPPGAADPDGGVRYRAENHDQSAPAGAPAERTDAPVLDTKGPALQINQIRSRERVFSHQPEIWHEPTYSQAPVTASNMYTPGICVNPPPHISKRGAETEHEHGTRERSGRLGRFVRAACLVILCAALAGAAAYGVMEYRVARGDFNTEVVNQVVIGGNTGSHREDGNYSTAIAVSGAEMSAEDIYVMACSQVVSIKTEMETMGGIFGSSGSTTAVAGSGFIISSDGYILTNYHVVEAAYLYELPLVVCLNDGTEYAAKVIGYEVNNDVAVIKIEASGLNPAVIANSDNINPGQTVYAVGNPLGDYIYTMTDGIVSARDRVVSVEGKSINAFQFSAAVNSGNSGGPLYDTKGEVIGIVTAKPMRYSVEGIGFAIPINDAILIAAELIEHGYITGRPLIGITVDTVNSAHAEFFDFVEGVLVKSVSPGSAAEKAGIQFRDIIIKLGDTEVKSRDELVFAMRKYKAGDTTTLTVWRGGEEIELAITFDEDLTAGQPRSTQQQQQPETQQPKQTMPAP